MNDSLLTLLEWTIESFLEERRGLAYQGFVNLEYLAFTTYVESHKITSQGSVGVC